jgi:hypothetical protein
LHQRCFAAANTTLIQHELQFFEKNTFFVLATRKFFEREHGVIDIFFLKVISLLYARDVMTEVKQIHRLGDQEERF